MKEALTKYFNQAQTWADDNFGRIEQSRARYQIAFLVAMGLNIIALIAIAFLANYQTIIPLLVHHYTNGITTVEAIASGVPLNRAQIESDIVRYIQYRESYDISSYRAQFELINLLSNSIVGKEYISEHDVANKASPIHLLGKDIRREVRIYSINFLDSLLANEDSLHRDHKNLVEAVFSLIDTDKTTGKATTSHYNAMISWRYISPSTSPAERWQNWDGFEVTRYSKQARAVEKNS